jgi:hypothetical protein
MPDRKIKEWVEERIAYWGDKLLLNNWSFGVIYAKDSYPDEDPNTVRYADIGCDTSRRRGMITFYPEFFKERTKSVQEKTIIHELCHCITDEMNYLHWKLSCDRLVTNRERLDARERATEHIAEIVLRMKK